MESMHRQYRITCHTINIIGITKRVQIFKKSVQFVTNDARFFPYDIYNYLWYQKGISSLKKIVFWIDI